MDLSHRVASRYRQAAESRSLSDIAREVRKDWKQVNFAAVPYLEAMEGLDKITDSYGSDSARSIVLYFLNNASQWRGPKAKEIKAELKAMLKSKSASEKTAGSTGYYNLMALLGGENKVMETYHRLDEDTQSHELFGDVIRKIAREMELSSGAEEALSRVRGIVERGKSWDMALIRNNVFKAAHSLGIPLPSGMF